MGRVTNDNINTACRWIAVIGCGGLLLVLIVLAVVTWVVMHGG